MTEEKIILVKKKDGSFVKMKFSDLKKKPSIVQKEEKIKIVNENKLTKEDFQSPLEDEEIKKIDHSSFNQRTDEVVEIINGLSFKLVEQAEKNLKNSLVLFLKDIKSKEQVTDLLRQPVYLGGADLTDVQLKELFKTAIEKISHIVADKNNLVGSFKKIKTSQTLPMKEGEVLPSVSSPFNSFVHKPSFNKEIKETKSLDDLIGKAEPIEENVAKMLKFGKSTKTVVEDIISPKNVNFGPIEEIKNFTLTDFRRLSSDKKEAVSRLRQKFINLKEESFLFYLQAIEAWQQSPLYKKYMERICESLNKNLHLSDLIKKEDDLTGEEIKLLVQMEKDL
ncbi:MAG: hypothetical protein Q7J14_01430 [Candidatus Magasanikbacteria bacterium]|nr:hypothetical protein [Candidatus Magasanikbacteria bacterium]